MNRTYELASTTFTAETANTQKLQMQLLKENIQRLLIKKNDSEIVEAIHIAEEHEKYKVADLIENITQDTINTQYIVDHTQNIRSDLFLIPIIIDNDNAKNQIVSLKTFEKYIHEGLLQEELIDEKAQVILAPMLLNEEKAKNMLESQWYDLHSQIIENANQRFSRPMFSHDFTINHIVNHPEIFYIVGIISQDNDPHKEPSTTPNFLGNSFYVDNEKNKFTQKIQTIMQNKMKHLHLIILPPNSIYPGVLSALQAQQELLVATFIENYANKSNIEYVVLSLNKPSHFCIFAWDHQNNKILNYILIEPLHSDFQVSTDTIMNYFTQTEKNIYIGNTIITENEMLDYTHFDFDSYLKIEGATLIQSEENNYL